MQVTYCADAIDFAYLPGDHEPHVLLGVRSETSDAYPGCHCIPGGEVEEDELAREAAARELAEETGLKIDPGAFDLVDVLDSPGRDPRGNVVSAAYVVVLTVRELPAVTGADDLDSAAWYPVANVWNHGLPMAFDHADAIETALGQVEAAAAK
jgi:8-oxo-dGTP diphosphatase